MNKITIPTSVPVQIYDFKKSEDKRYGTAKLKVFFVGQTADKRLFTQSFADKVVETLPSTPVVAFYSEKDEDFIGHNKVQYSYGHVPENAEIKFEKDDDGVTWLITDIILYTERTDNIGEVANKIVGKQHSLELNPNTLKYKVNKDSSGHFMNVEFLSGEFIGLSVLGDNETPAFKGSGFFNNQEDLGIVMQNKFSQFLDLLKIDGGKIEVEESTNYFTLLSEKFAEITMQDFQKAIYKALETNSIYGYIVENTENYAIISQWDDNDSQIVYNKYNLSVNESGEITLGDSVRVFAKFLTAEQIQELNSATTANTTIAVAETTETTIVTATATEDAINVAATAKSDADDKDENEAAKDKDKEEGICKKDEDKESQCADKDDASKDNGKDDEGDKDDPKKEDDSDDTKDEVGKATSNPSITALSDSERAELEKYRHEEKIRLVNEYKEDLTEEIIAKYTATIDTFSLENLTAALAIEFRNFKKANEQERKQKTITKFASITPENYNDSNPVDVIRKYK